MKTHFADFIDWQIAEGSNGLVPCGTTGEVATLRFRRASPGHRDRGRSGAGPRSGHRRLRQQFDRTSTIEKMRVAKEAGADAALIVVPYYNKPSQAGLAAHFRAAAESSTCRSSSTTSRRARSPTYRSKPLPRFHGCRPSSESRTRPAIWAVSPPSASPAASTFVQLSGNDDMALGFQRHGRSRLHFRNR